MSLYSSPFYSTQFYGTDVNGNPPGGIFGLNAYQNVDGTAVLYWRYDPCTAASNSFTWTVDTDLVPNFDSVHFRTYSSVSNPNYIAGGVNKGMAVPTYERMQGTSTPMYWRVQGHYGGADTGYVSSVYYIPEAIDDLVRQDMLNLLPDVIYKKDFAAGDLQVQSIVLDGALVSGNTISLDVDGFSLTPVAFAVSSQNTLSLLAAEIAARPNVGTAVAKSATEIVVTANAKDVPIRLDNANVTGGATRPIASIVQRNSTNVNRFYTSLGQELDAFNIELILTDADLFTQFVRDQSLNKNFASLLALQRPGGMQTIDFREIIRTIIKKVGDTPSVAAIKSVINTMFCEDPTLTLVRDTLDMYVDDPSSTPPVDPFWVDDASSIPPVLPATIWDDHNLAFGVIININNPLGLTIPRAFVEQIIGMLKPIHAPVYITGI